MAETSAISLRAFWEATRPRMFPIWLSSGIIPGAAAAVNGVFDVWVLLLETLLCYVLLSLSCWADEYGDLEKGVDNECRIGPIRPMQRGLITPSQMLKGCAVLVLASCVIAAALIAHSFAKNPSSPWIVLVFVAAGAASIWAAYAYTMGKHPYGYAGLGDFASFFFFGIVAGLGGYYLYAHTIDWMVLLPMSSAGLLLAATINLQNLRDFENDRACGKFTTAVKLGRSRAIVYHYVLVSLALTLYTLFPVLHRMTSPLNYLFVVGFVPLAKHCRKFARLARPGNDPRRLDTLMWPLTRAMGIAAGLFCVSVAL